MKTWLWIKWIELTADPDAIVFAVLFVVLLVVLGVLINFLLTGVAGG